MAPLKVSRDLRPMSELKRNTAEVLQQASDTGRPVVLTQRGRGVAVLLSVAAFEELERAGRRQELQTAVDAAEQEVAAGRHVGHTEVRKRLLGWAKGGR